ncbi:MAG: TldD/PmbA family protein [Dehalococcoidia bacterium]|nr:TldD/PmbA family protein [Dehalococcoidia bacterium]
MLDKGNIRDRMSRAIKNNKADYLEIRLEESRSRRLSFRGRELEDIGSASGLGCCVRALVKGGWGFASFNNLDLLEEKMGQAVAQARLIGNETSKFTLLEAIEDYVDAPVRKSPFQFSLYEVKSLMDKYVTVIWSIPKIQTSIIFYGDSEKIVHFANSEGSFIRQSRQDVSLRVSVVAREGGEVQQAGISLGSNGDFGIVEGLYGKIEKTAHKAVEILSSPKIKGGEKTVVLDPILAGVFVHEAFGHLSESDFIYENENMRKLMTLGRCFGGKHLNIVDGAAVPGRRGSFKYDDEGVPATKTYLISEGILVGRLHSRETAAKMGEKVTGNARAVDYRFPPIVRMTNTFIEPGEMSFDQLIGDVKDGVYVKNWFGGTTSMEMFTFSSAEAYRIRGGRVEEMVRPVTLSGNVFNTLEMIDAVGNDLDMNEGGGCGKGGQMPLPVSNGSPHIRIQKCLVGGR